jgi:hypothetical protein
VQESKGLEYENIILFNFISDNASEFNSICEGVSMDALHGGEPVYARGKDKADKSLDAYKFYINALYVAITRAVRNVYIIEKSRGHKLPALLGISEISRERAIKEDVSTTDDWKREARRLEKMGKSEQAEAIRKNILVTEKPNWTPMTVDRYLTVRKEALEPEHFNKKAKDQLFDFALIHDQRLILEKLAALHYKRAEKYADERSSILRKYYQYYRDDNMKMIVQEINKYGIDYRDIHNFTPLHAAVYAGALKITAFLLENGADPGLPDTFYKTPIQIALMQAFMNREYAKTRLGKIYPMLLADALSVQIEGRLIKFDQHKAEFLALHLFLALQSSIQQTKNFYQAKGVEVNDFIEKLQDFPEMVVPPYRKKREYWLAILAKHEIMGKNPYNKKLFTRIERGFYILNPELQLRVKDSWIPVDEMINCQGISIEDIMNHSRDKHERDMEEYRKNWEKVKQKRERMAFLRQKRGGWNTENF